MDGIDIRALANLIKPEFEDGSDDENKVVPNQGNKHAMGPGSIGPPKKSNVTSAPSPYDPVVKKSSNNKDIWDPNEVTDILVDTFDKRKEPVFQIKYKQAVTSEDIYLQLGQKTPASFSCEEVVITIQLPNEQLATLDLNVTPNQLDLRGLHHRLALPLPDPVNPQKENAKWDSETSTLTVTLRLNREMDPCNM